MSAILRLGLRSKAATFMGLLAVMLLLAALATSWVFIDLTRERYGAEVIRNHALLTREQLMLPVSRELALAQKFADSDITRRFMRNEQDAASRTAFFDEAEAFRRLFADHSQFAASRISRHYFFNDATRPFSSEARGTLQPDMPTDAWFFNSIEKRSAYNINIDIDQNVHVSKVWINVLVQEGVLSRNRRNFRHPSSSPATSASKSIILPSLWKV